MSFKYYYQMLGECEALATSVGCEYSEGGNTTAMTIAQVVQHRVGEYIGYVKLFKPFVRYDLSC